MGRIVDLACYRVERERYEFVYKATLVCDRKGKKRKYFCIALEDRSTKIIVSLTGWDKYIFDPNSGIPAETSNEISVSHVVMFLNYLLHNTDIELLKDVSVEEIRCFLKATKIDNKGEEKKSETWWRIVVDIYNFLENYSKHYKIKEDLSYNIDDLIEKRDINHKYNNVHIQNGKVYIPLGVMPPKSNDAKHRNRSIMRGHLEALLYAIKLYDPMLYLPVVLMAYAGLRIGEVINLTFADIYAPDLATVVDDMKISLAKSDRYRKGKTHTGVIKKIREQRVYSKFVDKIRQAIEFQKDYLHSIGLKTEGNNPIVYNKQRRPISVKSFGNRLRNLFYDHFLRILKISSESTDFEGETQAYIDAYEREYPGSHMLRHWFTMYLVTVEQLSPPEVRKSRGDSPKSDAYEVYLDVNSDIVQEYKNTAYSFQEQLLRDIYA